MKKMRFKRFSDKSLRRPYWDYRRDGAYFITICTKNRVRYFGEVIEGKMELSSLGVIANTLWNEIPEHTRNCRLGAFVIMPDHVHGILILKNNGGYSNPNPIKINDAFIQDLFDISIEKYHPSDFGRFKKNVNVMSQISPKANSISAIIRSYKSAVTKRANELGYCFQWQSRFHDRMIRDKRAFWVISRYIENNPKKWKDAFNSWKMKKWGS
jgi:REP element-mobilizing transposase RayT